VLCVKQKDACDEEVGMMLKLVAMAHLRYYPSISCINYTKPWQHKQIPIKMASQHFQTITVKSAANYLNANT
jgi:hypothetical protein